MYGITGLTCSGRPIYGDFNDNPYTVEILDCDDTRVSVENIEKIKDAVYFDYTCGIFRLKQVGSPTPTMGYIKRSHVYPYTFSQRYEAADYMSMFKNRCIVENQKKFMCSSDLKYTFGLEFETAVGCIPEYRCFIDGLIPLRDGSIGGNEYSTIVLKGTKGLNLLYQACNTLREYTMPNKECALHIHFGGYPVDPDAIFTLYSVFRLFQDSFNALGNRFMYNTDRYKANGKNYCQKLPTFDNFNDMYEAFVGIPYFGNLYQSHPADTSHQHKWNITSRYYAFNFINMICFDSPKTVEIRCLRPSFNFSKIYTYILIFNALLIFAEKLWKQYGALSPDKMYELLEARQIPATLTGIIQSVYTPKKSSIILDNIDKLRQVADCQREIQDFTGSITSFEDEIMTFNYIIQ